MAVSGTACFICSEPRKRLSVFRAYSVNKRLVFLFFGCFVFLHKMKRTRCSWGLPEKCTTSRSYILFTTYESLLLCNTLTLLTLTLTVSVLN